MTSGESTIHARIWGRRLAEGRRGGAWARAARRAIAAAIRLAPGGAAGAVVWERSGKLLLGVLVAACVVGAADALERRRLPLHLMPIAGVVARNAAVAAGVAAAYAASFAFTPVPLDELLPALVTGWVVLEGLLLVSLALERRLASRLAVIGSEGLVRSLREELRLAGLSSLKIAGRIEPGSGLGGSPDDQLLGWIDDLGAIVTRERIDLLVGGGTSSRRRRRGDRIERRVSEEVSASCLHLPVSYIGANELFEELFAHVPLGRIDAGWFEHVLHPRFRSASPIAKRLLGAGLAAIGLVLAAPFLAVAAVVIKLTDGGPVIYRQHRLGERGELISVLKLRTMAPAPEGGPAGWNHAGRVTGVGRLLRRFHLDELPQLWNVVRGDMALVGPRPERPEIVAELERRLPFYGRRHLMRPGISGWAQVRCGYSGSITGTVWKLAHDLYYLKHRSVLFDLLILIETLATPVRDPRLAHREPDREFVLEAIREEDESGGPGPAEAELGFELERRRFRRRTRTARPAGAAPR